MRRIPTVTWRPRIALRQHEERDLRSHAARIGLSDGDLITGILRGWLDRQPALSRAGTREVVGGDLMSTREAETIISAAVRAAGFSS